jgi:hypothetical protein
MTAQRATARDSRAMSATISFVDWLLMGLGAEAIGNGIPSVRVHQLLETPITQVEIDYRGFIACPVALYPAMSDTEKISFNQINRNTGHRASYVHARAHHRAGAARQGPGRYIIAAVPVRGSQRSRIFR